MQKPLIFWVIAIILIALLAFMVDFSRVWDPVASEQEISDVEGAGDFDDGIADIDAGIEGDFEFVQ